MFSAIATSWSHIASSWQKSPKVFSSPVRIRRDDVFDIFKLAATRFRDGAEGAPGKIYADGINRANELEKYLPLPEESFEAYDRRMTVECGHTTYLVYAFDLSPYHHGLRESLRRLKHAIVEPTKQEDKWGPVVAEMFMGRYQATSGGIHKENCATLHYVLHGKKTIRVWPEPTWDDSVEKILQQKDVRTGEDEYFLVDANFDDQPSHNIDLTGTGGDVFYWPERWWHVGRSQDLTCALTVAIHPAPAATESTS